MDPLAVSKRALRWAWARTSEALSGGRLRQLCSTYDLNGYDRIYLVHIRKTGGTSLNNMFLGMSGDDSQELYQELANRPTHRVIRNGLVFVGWDIASINRGLYFYAFSHHPFHKLSLPERTFAFSCFRDPMKRVVSHYNMLMDSKVNQLNSRFMKREGAWLGDSFRDFLDRVPREHLQNQLYMFSPTFDVEEALANVGKLSHWFFGDAFDEGVSELNEKTGLSLSPIHIRKSGAHAQLSDDDSRALREALREELTFIEALRATQAHAAP